MQSIECLIDDPGVISLIRTWSHAFMEIDREIFSTIIPLLLLIEEGLLTVTNESMCMKYSLIAQSKLVQEKVWLG